MSIWIPILSFAVGFIMGAGIMVLCALSSRDEEAYFRIMAALEKRPDRKDDATEQTG